MTRKDYTGNAQISSEALQQMRERARPNTRWIAFQNMALDSSGLGSLRFLQTGEGATFTEIPSRYPDTQFGTGWAYLPVGVVNLETGEIEELL